MVNYRNYVLAQMHKHTQKTGKYTQNYRMKKAVWSYELSENLQFVK